MFMGIAIRCADVGAGYTRPGHWKATARWPGRPVGRPYGQPVHWQFPPAWSRPRPTFFPKNILYSKRHGPLTMPFSLELLWERHTHGLMFGVSLPTFFAKKVGAKKVGQVSPWASTSFMASSCSGTPARSMAPKSAVTPASSSSPCWAAGSSQISRAQV